MVFTFNLLKMLQIDIVGFAGEDLVLEVNGHSNNGKSSAAKGEDVFWKVKQGTDVDYIDAITMKEIAWNNDIFNGGAPPAAQGNKKNWRGKINSKVDDAAIYVYNITWVKKSDGSTHVFDPLITIKPKVKAFESGINPMFAVVGGTVSSFIYWRKERIATNKLKRPAKNI